LELIQLNKIFQAGGKIISTVFGLVSFLYRLFYEINTKQGNNITNRTIGTGIEQIIQVSFLHKKTFYTVK